MPEDVAVAAPAAGAGAAVADTGAGSGAGSAEPSSINFDFGGGDTLEGSFEDAPITSERFPDWDKTLEEKYGDEQYKDLLKMAKDGHFREKDWRGTGFRSAKDVRSYQESVNQLAESFGRQDGLKGVEAIKAESQEWASFYAGMAAGDLSVAEGFLKDNPEAIDKLTPAMLSIWHKSSPDNYSSTLARVMMATLAQPDASGMTLVAQLNQLESLIGDSPQGKQIIKAIRDRMAGYEELAGRKAAEKAPDFDKRAKELDAKERNLALTSLNNSAAPIVNKAISQAVKQLMRGRNLPEATMSKIEREVSAAFLENRIGDKDYQRNLQDVLRSGDEAKVMKILKSKIGRSLPGIARTISGTYLSMGGTNEPRAEAGSGGVSSGPKKMPWTGAKAPTGVGPHPDEMDIPRMRQKHGDRGMREMLERGEFYAKKDRTDTTYTW